ncbi:MFS transporter [Virgibacillus proomii]|uniref:MFS transporter n=1 Tax=Virgibacillus proomii TaxID=84407 RepID=UPI001C107493|nr:MFS transporter [Virgibacillus proomii]MBU5265932.1 MFS transporter [Virgibacillus proomii]
MKDNSTLSQHQPEIDSKTNRRILQNIIFLLAGKLVSDFGSFVYAFVMGLFVLKETGSGLGFSAVLIFNMIPRVILGPFAGVIADKINRKKIIITTDILSGLSLLLLYGISVFAGFNIVYIYLLSALLAVYNTFFDVSFNASIPDLVNRKRITKVNSYYESIVSFSQIVSPIIGGVIFGLIDIKLFLLFTGITFLISALSESFIDFNVLREKKNTEKETKKKIKKQSAVDFRSMFGEIKEGFGYIKTQSAIFTLFIFALGINFLIALGIEVPVPFIVNEVLELTPTQFGIISGAFPVGIFVGSIVLSALPEFKKKYKLFTVALFIDSIGVLLCGIPGINIFGNHLNDMFFFFYTGLYFLLGFVVIFVNVPIRTMLMTTIEEQYRGRVFGVIRSLSSVITPAGLLLSGLLIEYVPAFIIPMFAGVVQVLMIVLFSSNKAIRTL